MPLGEQCNAAAAAAFAKAVREGKLKESDMRLVLLGLAAPLAATLVPAVPAAAQSLPTAGFTAGPAFAAGQRGVTVHRNAPGRVHGDFRFGDGDGHDDDDR